MNGRHYINLESITFDAAKADVVTKYQSGTETPVGKYANITSNGANGAQNIVINNCTFEGTYATPDAYAAIAIYDVKADRSQNYTITNCTFACDALYYIYGYKLTKSYNSEILIANNSFGTLENTVTIPIYAGGNKHSWQIVNNTFYNWTESTFMSSRNDASGDILITVKENNFVNTLDEAACIIALRMDTAASAYKDENTTLVFTDNRANYGLDNIKNTVEMDGYWGCYYVEKASEKTITTANSAAELKTLMTGIQPNEVVIIDANGADIGDTDGVKFQDGVTVMNATVSGASNYGNKAYGTVVFENCTFASTNSYAAHFDGGSDNSHLIFRNCTFSGWNSFGTAIKGITMEGCTFDFNGNYGCVRFYQPATVSNCVFTDAFRWMDVAKDVKVSIDNCTGLEGKIFNYSGTGTWVVDGVDVSAQITTH